MRNVWRPRGWATAWAMALLFAALSAQAHADVAELLKQGDAFDAKLDNTHALEMYLQAEQLGASDPDTLTRIARQYVLLMNDTPSESKQKELGEKALAYSKRAVSENPEHAKSLLSLAICYGRLVPFQDTRGEIEYSRFVKEYAEKALMLDPSDSYAWHVLGVWNFELAHMGAISRAFVKLVYGSLPAASNEEAERLFRKAVQLAPDHVSHHAELGRTLAALGKKEEAREELRRALSLPSREKDDPESKKRAAATLASL